MTDLEPILTLLNEIRDAVLRQQNDAKETEQKRREKERVRKARWRKLSRNVPGTKETKSEKRDIPPTPPIERKGKSLEKSSSLMRTGARVCVCAREGLTPEREIALVEEIADRWEKKTPPCRFELLAWAHLVWQKRDKDADLHATFDDLRQNGWTDALTGKRIGNWAAFIRRVIAKRLPPREFAKAVRFKKNRPINILERTEAEIMEQWGINDEQG